MKLGKVTDILFTSPGGLGNQYTKIDGVVYATWFDARETAVRVGCEVEFEVGTDPNFRCPTALIRRVIREDLREEKGA